MAVLREKLVNTFDSTFIKKPFDNCWLTLVYKTRHLYSHGVKHILKKKLSLDFKQSKYNLKYMSRWLQPWHRQVDLLTGAVLLTPQRRVVCHGRFSFDSASWQVQVWQALASHLPGYRISGTACPQGNVWHLSRQSGLSVPEPREKTHKEISVLLSIRISLIPHLSDTTGGVYRFRFLGSRHRSTALTLLFNSGLIFIHCCFLNAQLYSLQQHSSNKENAPELFEIMCS